MNRQSQFDTVTRVAPIGLRFWDAVTSSTIGAGLRVFAYREIDPDRRYEAYSSRSNTFVLSGLPLLGNFEFGGEPLNEREREILAGAADGETAVETGERLYLSPETVKSYRKRIIAKLGARNGTHAVALALRSGRLR